MSPHFLVNFFLIKKTCIQILQLQTSPDQFLMFLIKVEVVLPFINHIMCTVAKHFTSER